MLSPRGCAAAGPAPAAGPTGGGAHRAAELLRSLQRSELLHSLQRSEQSRSLQRSELLHSLQRSEQSRSLQRSEQSRSLQRSASRCRIRLRRRRIEPKAPCAAGLRRCNRDSDSSFKKQSNQYNT
jgi:hypothetical protein